MSALIGFFGLGGLTTTTVTTARITFGPDHIATGGGGHITNMRVRWNGTEVAGSPFISNPESGNDGLYDWKTVDIALGSVVLSGSDVLEIAYDQNVNLSDTLHVQAVRLIDVGGKLLNAQYPRGFTYTDADMSATTDSATETPIFNQGWTSGGTNGWNQLNKQTGAFEQGSGGTLGPWRPFYF